MNKKMSKLSHFAKIFYMCIQIRYNEEQIKRPDSNTKKNNYLAPDAGNDKDKETRMKKRTQTKKNFKLLALNLDVR